MSSLKIKKDASGSIMGTIDGKFSANVSEFQVRDIVKEFPAHCQRDHLDTSSSFSLTRMEKDFIYSYRAQ